MIDYNRILSEKIKEVNSSGIRKFFDLASTMEGVISLGVGEPDFSTPYNIRQAGIASLERGKTWYTANAGLSEMREGISDYLSRRFDITYDPGTEVLVTVGGSEGIDICIRALLNPGDEVLIPEPCFVSYYPITQLTGGVPVVIPTKMENEFRLTADELKEHITDKTKLLILPFPNNPTGAVMERKHLEEIAEVLRGTDIIVLSDEIYAELVYTDEDHVAFPSIEGMWERTILINGFSKAYAMTGWRLGYACGPAALIAAMTKVHQFAIMCAPTTSQYAAITALREGDDSIKMMRDEYEMRGKFLVAELNRLGLDCFEPKGAFYVFPYIGRTGLTSEEFCEALLSAEKVAVVPGTAFGESGEGHVRISYSYSLEHLTTALERIKRFLQGIGYKT